VIFVIVILQKPMETAKDVATSPKGTQYNDAKRSKNVRHPPPGGASFLSRKCGRPQRYAGANDSEENPQNCPQDFVALYFAFLSPVLQPADCSEHQR
jgi:hypothetical protein